MDALMTLLTGDYAMNFWVPAVFFIYGAFVLIKPPRYKCGGFATKRALKNERVWEYVHRVLGILCLVIAAVLGVSGWLTYTLIGGTVGFVVQIVLDVLALVLLAPIINALTDRKFDFQ